MSTVGCWLSHVAKRFSRACGRHVQPAIVELNPSSSCEEEEEEEERELMNECSVFKLSLMIRYHSESTLLYFRVVL